MEDVAREVARLDRAEHDPLRHLQAEAADLGAQGLVGPAEPLPQPLELVLGGLAQGELGAQLLERLEGLVEAPTHLVEAPAHGGRQPVPLLGDAAREPVGGGGDAFPGGVEGALARRQRCLALEDEVVEPRRERDDVLGHVPSGW
ncbi:MAG: hypothetical protein CVU56_21150 [Deltaproteobacteria bacterium HGW-Deltaproteobacteria-14]|nr:MAG: hypothetical protein CVU56_21150 [Deltaproteobacteria bacterium HGW-Deltaproteobacteria-14]